MQRINTSAARGLARSVMPYATQPPLINTRTISGTLVDSNGNPLAGYVVELHSDPITTITDTDGQYTFYNVDYTDHKLIVKTPKGEEITAFTLSFLEDDIFSANISKKGVDITFTKSTITVDIQVVVDADQVGASISQVLGKDIPETSDSFWSIGMLLWIGGIVVLVIIAALFIILRKRKVNDIYD